MKRCQGWLKGGALLVVLVLPLWSVAPALAQLAISEVLADPASDWDGDGEVDYKDDEWVEVVNQGTNEIDLSLYWLRDGLGDAPHLNLFGMLAPEQVAVFYGSDALAWQEANDIGATGFSLNNGGDTVQLLITVAGQEELDVVQSVVYEDHEADDDRSSGRLPESGAWALFDGLNPYDGDEEPLGTGCDPTPGLFNDCPDQTPAEATSWSRLKATYR